MLENMKYGSSVTFSPLTFLRALISQILFTMPTYLTTNLTNYRS